VDDVLVNATGAALAALASRRWWLLRTPTQQAASASRSGFPARRRAGPPDES
jgi:hypothetical protein